MKTTRLIIVAVGGQGNLLAAHVLSQAALAAQVPVRMSEIHGMAQRGGVVESALVFGEAQSAIISDGEADILVGFEPLETLRALPRCHQETVVITSLSRLSPFTVTVGQGQYPPLSEIQKIIRRRVKRFVAFEAGILANQAGNNLAVNMVLLGALMQTGLIPIEKEAVLETIRTKTKAAFVEINTKAFQLGFETGENAAGA